MSEYTASNGNSELLKNTLKIFKTLYGDSDKTVKVRNGRILQDLCWQMNVAEFGNQSEAAGEFRVADDTALFQQESLLLKNTGFLRNLKDREAKLTGLSSIFANLIAKSPMKVGNEVTIPLCVDAIAAANGFHIDFEKLNHTVMNGLTELAEAGKTDEFASVFKGCIEDGKSEYQLTIQKVNPEQFIRENILAKSGRTGKGVEHLQTYIKKTNPEFVNLVADGDVSGYKSLKSYRKTPENVNSRHERAGR